MLHLEHDTARSGIEIPTLRTDRTSNMLGAGKSNGVHQYSLFDIGPYTRLQCYSLHVIEFIFSSTDYRWNLQGGAGIEKKDPGSIFLLRRFEVD